MTPPCVAWPSESMKLTQFVSNHYNDVIMSTTASQITSLTIVYSAIYSRADQIKHQSSASLAFVRGIHRSPVNSPHKGPVTRKMFTFDDVIMHFSHGARGVTMWYQNNIFVLLINCKRCRYSRGIVSNPNFRCYKLWASINLIYRGRI